MDAHLREQLARPDGVMDAAEAPGVVAQEQDIGEGNHADAAFCRAFRAAATRLVDLRKQYAAATSKDADWLLGDVFCYLKSAAERIDALHARIAEMEPEHATTGTDDFRAWPRDERVEKNAGKWAYRRLGTRHEARGTSERQEGSTPALALGAGRGSKDTRVDEQPVPHGSARTRNEGGLAGCESPTSVSEPNDSSFGTGMDAGYEWFGAFETMQDAAAAAFADERGHLVREPAQTHPNWPQRQRTGQDRARGILSASCVDVVEVGRWERIEVDAAAIARCAIEELHDQMWAGEDGLETHYRVPASGPGAAVPGLVKKIIEWAHEEGLAPVGMRIGSEREYDLAEARALWEARVSDAAVQEAPSRAAPAARCEAAEPARTPGTDGTSGGGGRA